MRETARLERRENGGREERTERGETERDGEGRGRERERDQREGERRREIGWRGEVQGRTCGVAGQVGDVGPTCAGGSHTVQVDPTRWCRLE